MALHRGPNHHPHQHRVHQIHRAPYHQPPLTSPSPSSCRAVHASVHSHPAAKPAGRTHQAGQIHRQGRACHPRQQPQNVNATMHSCCETPWTLDVDKYCARASRPTGRGGGASYAILATRQESGVCRDRNVRRAGRTALPWEPIQTKLVRTRSLSTRRRIPVSLVHPPTRGREGACRRSRGSAAVA